MVLGWWVVMASWRAGGADFGCYRRLAFSYHARYNGAGAVAGRPCAATWCVCMYERVCMY